MRLHEECEALKERYMMMQMQASELTKEKADFSAKVESLQTQLRALQSGSSSAAAQSAAQEAELQKLRNTIAELHGQVETMKVRLCAVSLCNKQHKHENHIRVSPFFL